VLAAAAAAARSARAKVTVADESQRAAPELALRVKRERGDFAESYANTIGIRLKIPFSSGAQVRREVSGAQAEANQAEAEMLRTQTRVQLEIERARSALDSTGQQLVLAQERMRLSAENLRLSEKAFALGETDLTTLLRIRAAAFDAEAFLGRQRVGRAAAISRLNQALGVLP
jgi:cobalt-zinc-cadmium efflux system outer membrane protein